MDFKYNSGFIGLIATKNMSRDGIQVWNMEHMKSVTQV